MTAIDDARPPVDLDLLADYFEGLLTGAEAQRVADLVVHEPRWAATAARLRAALPAVHEDLLGLAEPMPPDVLDRILAALPGATHRADPTRQAPAGGPHPATRPSPPPAPGRGAPPAGPARSAPPGRPGSRRRRGLGAGVGLVAVVVLVAIGTVVGIGLNHGASLSKQNSTSGAAPARLPSGASDSVESYRNTIDIATLPRTVSGFDYGPGFKTNSGGSVPGHTAQAPQATPGSAAGSPQPPDNIAPAPLARLQSDSALLDCLAGVAARLGAPPTSVDYAYYVGRPALIVRLANGMTAAVGMACTAANPDFLDVS